MDTQMVERIPKPPKEDVIASAAGLETEGYTHQLYFHYPKQGAFQTLVDAYAAKAQVRSSIKTGIAIKTIEGDQGAWRVVTEQGVFEGERLVNCMPLHELFKLLVAPQDVRDALAALKYNSIHIVALHVRKDTIGEHFALYFADPDVIFHRLSKLNFLGEAYCHEDGSSTLLVEVTFRPDSYLALLSVEDVQRRVIDDLFMLELIDKEDVISSEVRTEQYAYVIYDLDHRKNADKVLGYLESIGVRSAGRFAQFEYLNSDGVVENTLKLARELNLD
jgi:protoporphyrinogen oxidase